jgi:DNA-binding transcriptional ArsR family regulator
MEDSRPRRIDHIEADVKSHIVCSNINRVCILHLLRKSPKQEMQAEEMAYRLGLSHRTILYHLDVLHDYELVEVRGFRKRGSRLMRSIWGLRKENGHLSKVISKIEKRFDPGKLNTMIAKCIPHQ